MNRDRIKFALSNGVFAVHEQTMQSAIDFLEQGKISAVVVDDRANDSVIYTEMGSLAIIEVEGAMYKKNIGGFCMSVLSYPDIIAKIDIAEANPNIKDILFWVDTPGGDINGLDELAERIYTSPKNTTTLYKNMGASAGIYAFTASNKIYAASKNTVLGSIGVVVNIFVPQADGKERLTIYSENAPNKGMSLDEAGLLKIKATINQYEQYFFEAVERNTGFNKERIISVFNAGDVIFAEKALEEGFINGIISFNELTNNLVSKAVPISENRNKPASIKLKEQGMTKEDILASTEYLNLQASHKAEIDGLNTLNASALAKAIEDAQEAGRQEAKLIAKEVVAMSFGRGLDKEFSLSLLDSNSIDGAKAKLVDSMISTGAISVKVADDVVDTKAHKEQLDKRCEELGVTFIGKDK